MAEKVEDLTLPTATVARIIKDALPEHIFVGKDARAALSTAASVFVLFLTSQASQEAQRTNRKTLLGQDVIKALEELEFDEFIEPLQTVLKDFREAKSRKAASKSKNLTQTDVEMEEEQEEATDEENGK
ncbi:hypothetical protein ABEB36_001555 [Hypothenemus hampei]|uniref:DNA polymerase epsilon subunit 3 n=1 Tax=Hypothenemus hampei TaxID=57062 RepID=A0ABD1FEY4_HYPHA